MRPQQQNRRMRGRGGNNNNNNNNNRKGPNPLTRSYESNGPDVKIRGSAQQIADKYTTLARDAQSAGDRVMAENYLQHAEHYNRIIAAAQAQMPQIQQPRDNRDEDFDDEDSDDNTQQAPVHAVNGNGHGGQPQQVNGHGPQPVIEGMPAEVAYQQDEMRAQRASGESEAAAGDQPAEQKAAEGEEAAPRRARRPRRPRNRAENAGQDSGEGQEPAAAEAQGSPEPQTAQD
ncbi:MAG TPA: DUF4167 domain-containing protein [Rhizobiaceae bacterium]|nr:DUF4167 domain-containing protein [Rhizobiaceae bacterium]